MEGESAAISLKRTMSYDGDPIEGHIYSLRECEWAPVPKGPRELLTRYEQYVTEHVNGCLPGTILSLGNGDWTLVPDEVKRLSFKYNQFEMTINNKWQLMK